MFNGTNLTLNYGVDQNTLMFGSKKDPLIINALSPSIYKSRYKKEIKQRYSLNSIHS